MDKLFQHRNRKNGKGGKLTKIELNALDKPLQDFLTAQMPLWTKTQEVQPKGVEFYEFIGKIFWDYLLMLALVEVPFKLPIL